MTSEQKFKNAIMMLHANNTYPGPTAINRALSRQRAHMNQLNGRETRWRRQVMHELSIPLQRAYQTHMAELMYGDDDPYRGW